MRLRSISMSMMLHVFVLLAFSLSASWLWTKERDHHAPPPVFVEIKTVSDRTQTDRRAVQRPDPQDQQQAAPEPPRATPRPPSPPSDRPPRAAESRRETAEVAAPPRRPDPEPVKAEPAPEPPPQPVIKPEEAEKKPDPPPPPERREVARPPQQDFGSVLRNLAVEETEAAQPVIRAPDPPKDRDDFLQRLNLGNPEEAQGHDMPLGVQLSVSEIDLLRRQLERCWNIPIGARDAQNLVIDIYLEVNPDRTVRRAEIVDQARYRRDSFFRAAAESALRAVHHPDCRPLQLPERKYDLWREIVVTFDPRYMF